MKTDNKKTKKKKTINDYLETKDKLLTAFSIFIALTLFSKETKFGFLSEVLSFMFLTISILIWFELWWTSVPSKKKSFTLRIFEHLLNFLTIGLVAYWIYGYKTSWTLFAFILLAGSFIALFVKLNYKYQIAVRFLETKFVKSLIIKRIIAYFIVFVIFIIIVFISALIVFWGIAPLIEIIEKEVMK